MRGTAEICGMGDLQRPLRSHEHACSLCGRTASKRERDRVPAKW